MNIKLLVTSMAAFASLAPLAQAVPTAYHNPATGSLRIVNDYEKLPGLYVLSWSSRFLVAPEAYMPVPGVGVFDIADVPAGIAFLNLPTGDYEIGKVTEPGTPCSDLIMQFYRYGTTAPISVGVIVCIPEPAAVALSTGFFFVVAIARSGVRKAKQGC